MDVTLVRFKGDGERRDFPIKGGRCLIGRLKTCDLSMPLPSVSREHCEIVVGDRHAMLRDLGSRNGTFHNGEPIEGETEIEPGDRIAVGPIVLTVQIDGEPEHIEPPLLDAPTLTDSPSRVRQSGEQKPTVADEEESVADIDNLIAEVEADESSVFDIDFYLNDEDEDEEG